MRRSSPVRHRMSSWVAGAALSMASLNAWAATGPNAPLRRNASPLTTGTVAPHLLQRVGGRGSERDFRPPGDRLPGWSRNHSYLAAWGISTPPRPAPLALEVFSSRECPCHKQCRRNQV